MPYFSALMNDFSKKKYISQGFVLLFLFGYSVSHVWLFVTLWTATHRLPYLSLSSRVCSNSCPLNQWCHPIILSTAIPFSSCLQSFPTSGSFAMSQFFAFGGQSIGVSASASVLPMNIQDWFPLGLTWSPCCPRDSQESSPTPQLESINSLVLSFLYGSTLTSIHDYWKNQDLTRQTFVSKSY